MTLLRAGSFTVRESRALNAGLEPVWNGELERRGESPIALSGYRGRSSIFHSPSYVKPEPEDMPRSESQRGGQRKRFSPAIEAEILEMLRKGVSYRQIERTLGISQTVPRRIGREHGIDRRAFSGSNQYVNGARRA